MQDLEIRHTFSTNECDHALLSSCCIQLSFFSHFFLFIFFCPSEVRHTPQRGEGVTTDTKVSGQREQRHILKFAGATECKYACEDVFLHAFMVEHVCIQIECYIRNIPTFLNLVDDTQCQNFD